MGSKRGAAEMEGDDGGGGEEEEEDEEEDREEDEELSQHEQQQREHEHEHEHEHENEQEYEDVDDDQQHHEHGHAPAKKPKLTKPQKGPSKRVTFHSDDDEENRRASGEHVNRAGHTGSSVKAKEDDDEEEENLEIELGKCQTVDPEKMQSILAQFTPEQMSRYECYRRSGFQKANMRRLLQSVAGCPISMPMTIVMSGIAKMFVGELVELGRIVMTERKESGPIRPCHIRESYRRLKLKGKVPLRTRPRLFR